VYVRGRLLLAVTTSLTFGLCEGGAVGRPCPDPPPDGELILQGQHKEQRPLTNVLVTYWHLTKQTRHCKVEYSVRMYTMHQELQRMQRVNDVTRARRASEQPADVTVTILQEPPCPHCRRKVRLLQKSATVAEKPHFSATVWTGF